MTTLVEFCWDEIIIIVIMMIIIECNKQAQKEYKTWHDWVGKVIHWELYKKLKFHLYTKMHKPESVLKNATHKIFWDFEIRTDHLISARRPDLVMITKKKKKKKKKKKRKENQPN